MTSDPAAQRRRKQHLVSAGYQRNFADDVWVSILDVRTCALVDPRRSVNANWKLHDFVSVVQEDGQIDDSLEHDFARDEKRILNIIRKITPAQSLSDQQRKAIDTLATMHLVRNMSFASTHTNVVGNWLGNGALDLADDPELARRFRQAARRDPNPGELEALVAVHAMRFATQPDLLVSGMRQAISSIPGLLAESRIQLVGSDPNLPGFILADNPILHGQRQLGRFGFANAGAIGDADIIVAPISRRLLAFYTRQDLPNVLVKTKRGVSRLNALLASGAVDEILCHPDDAHYVGRLLRHLNWYPANEFDQHAIE